LAASDIRADVRMDGVYFFRSFASYPVNKRLDPGDFSYCFMVRRGHLRLTIDFPEPKSVDLAPGSIVGISGLAPHRIHSLPDPGEGTPDGFPRVPISEQIDAGNDVELLLGVAPSESIALTNLIIGPLYLSRESSPECARRIWKASEMLDEEFVGRGEEYGQAIIVRRIAEIILINMTRSILEHTSKPTPEVVRSRGVILAIRAFLDAPLEEWSVDRLARLAGMSRTKFAEDFRRILGRTPMQTLARMRLTLVARRILMEDISVEEAADIAGYSSAAAFIRAFSREFGSTPLQWRKLQSANDGIEKD
jgi:AraC-like DNA-binding protein